MSPETDVDAPVSLFHPSVKATRAATTKAALGSFVAILLAIWILLPVFYGSVCARPAPASPELTQHQI